MAHLGRDPITRTRTRALCELHCCARSEMSAKYCTHSIHGDRSPDPIVTQPHKRSPGRQNILQPAAVVDMSAAASRTTAQHGVARAGLQTFLARPQRHYICPAPQLPSIPTSTLRLCGARKHQCPCFQAPFIISHDAPCATSRPSRSSALLIGANTACASVITTNAAAPSSPRQHPKCGTHCGGGVSASAAASACC